MTSAPAVSVKRVETHDELSRCLALRQAVFVVEQQVPVELELDEYDSVDAACIHFVATLGDDPARVVGTARMKVVEGKAKAQRVAVDKALRGQGVGRHVMRALESAARAKGLTAVVLSSQVSAIPFYETLGYVAHGDVYEDAGIPHRDMTKRL